MSKPGWDAEIKDAKNAVRLKGGDCWVNLEREWSLKR